MRLAISNLAWDVGEDDAVASLLRAFGVDAIDVVPGKYFPDLPRTTAVDTSRVRGQWADRGIEITGMQALLFGTAGLNVFGDSEAQAAMLIHLGAVCRIGAGLGATCLVFGSPKNRDRSAMADDRLALEKAVDFFRRLGDVAAHDGVTICLEPNPPRYGANFMCTSAETAAIVEAVEHPAIRMQLDTGAMTINGEDPATVLGRFGGILGHVHASEPDLVPLADGPTSHAAIGALLRDRLPHLVVSIEMLPAKHEPHLAAIERALRVAIRHYRDGSQARPS